MLYACHRPCALFTGGKTGTSVPVMGTTVRKPSLAGALLTPVQMRVLGLLFGQPDRRFQSGELIRLARGR